MSDKTRGAVASESPLFGEAGKRVERVEWGNLWPASSMFELRRKGDVDLAVSEEHAWSRAGHPLWGPDGKVYPVVVRRTVVTYTTEWEVVPPPPRTDVCPWHPESLEEAERRQAGGVS